MNKARWIWYPGDFEICHSLKLHSRREERLSGYPPFWSLSQPYASVIFKKTFSVPEDTTVKVISRSFGGVMLDYRFKPLNKEFEVKKGDHQIAVKITAVNSRLLSIYVNSEHLVTDDTWTVTHCTSEEVKVCDTPKMYREDDDPEVFPFSYERVDPVASENKNGGILYDFGRELFAKLVVSGADKDEKIYVGYGESAEEALDEYSSIIYDEISGSTEYELKARAYRYIFLKTCKVREVYSLYEYVPLETRAHFECDAEKVEKIWNTCEYTIHLNAREFFLDGIKRDRWVWSGDAYQSYKINDYLWFDADITKRTIRALLGRPPYYQHINTINDYSFYLIISIEEYYLYHGDRDFVVSVFENVKSLFAFINGRLDKDGFVQKIGDDWIFIDWSDMVKTGNICAEQILLWRAIKAMAALYAIVGGEENEKESAALYERAERFAEKIKKLYWKEPEGAFAELPDPPVSVKRHANIFAVIYDFVDEEKQRRILENVLENDAVTQITTPYFKFFELMAFCKLGKTEVAQKLIDSYWGGMIDLGATTIWEEFDPTKHGTEHYAMYGEKYGCSLCHAWGAGPIYLCGRYFLGVYPTAPGYASFEVAPQAGAYRRMSGKVPVNGGEVFVEYSVDNGVTCIRIRSDIEGGTLVFGGKRFDIPAGRECVFRF